MDNIEIRPYYLDDINLKAQVFVGLKGRGCDEYFTILNCTEKEIENMRKEELFRFFNEDIKDDSSYRVIKEMISYWVLDIINNNSVLDSGVKIYKWINEEEFEEFNGEVDDFKWGDVNSVFIESLNYSIKDMLIEECPESKENTYCIVGDTHGDLNFKVFFKARKAGYKNIFICGDFGYIWDGSEKENRRLDYLSSIGLNIYWIDGNHENFDLLEKYPVVNFNGGKAHKIRDNIYHLMRGEIFTFGDKKILAFGGANSTDKHLRKEGKSWWHQEVPSDLDKNNARKNLLKHNNKVDYIITHTAHTRALNDMNGNYRVDEVSDFLSEIYHTTEFDHWYFGHMHVNHTYVEGKSTCIYKKVLNLKL